MANKIENFGTYFVKKFIIEVKHKPHLLHNQKVPEILNEMMNDFDKVSIVNDGKNKVYQISNTMDYFLLSSDWSKIFVIFENVKDYESASKKANKILTNYLTKLKITSITRLGFRTMYLLPFSGDFKELVDYFISKFYNGISVYEPFGTIEDVGVVALTIKDTQFRGNLSFGPMMKNEVKQKIAEFKKFEDDFETSLLVDLDLYSDTSPLPTLSSFVENAYNSSRVKLIKFRENLNN